jgi:hypothetical protein
MLPGFRFLFAAIMLSMSFLVFGLGATALLRSAHEEFASNPAWRAAPEVKFAQQTEATMPVLATLRVETPGQKTPEDSTLPAAKAEAETTTSPTTAAQALPSEVAGPDMPTAPKPDVAVADSNRPASDAAPASPQSESVERGAAAEQPGEGSSQEPRDETKDETTVAAIVSTAPSPPDDPPLAAATDQSAADAAPAAASISTDPAATKIATLGGPPVDIETPTKANETPSIAKADGSGAKPDETAAKKRAEAKRAARHRIAAARARLAAQQAQQLQAGPFFQQPTPTARAR